jgi:hypothetical protein
MATEHFYSTLPVLENFSVITDFNRYLALPEDWYVVVADIRNSTGAIQSGRYKAVNIIGVSVITAIVNNAKPLSIPYIFGGDGATLCIPPGQVAAARAALVSTMLMARQSFDLKLRAGLVPMNAIHQAGAEVLVARHRVSRHYVQTAFAGGGVEYAERLVKDDLAGAAYRLPEAETATTANYSGLECRWDNVTSQHGEVIALIVRAIAPTLEQEAALYQEILAAVREIYGDDEACRPVHYGGLRLTFNNSKLGHEARVRTFAQGRLAYFRYWIKLRIQNVLGWLFMTYNLNAGGIAWGDYKKDLVLNTDHRKFDGVLRAVLSGNSEQRLRLNARLEQMFQKKECVYGLHVSASALITCLISSRSGEHYHFIDGADGGYAAAATAMKARLRHLDRVES